MKTLNLKLIEKVHVLELINNDDENRFTSDVMQEYHSALDEVETYQGNTALLITCKHPKTFSTGIKLDWLKRQDESDQKKFVLSLLQVLYRIAMLNAPTIACINGNAYAGGAFVAAAADFRVMRADRGRFCFPEVNIDMTFPPLMVDIIDLLPNKHAVKHLMLTGKAYTGEECLAANLVDATCPAEELQEQAYAMAQLLSQKDRQVYTEIRASMLSNIARHKEALGLA